MKINELSTTGTKEQPSELMLSRLEAEAGGKPFAEYLAGFDFDSAADIAAAVRMLALRETEDAYMRDKDNRAAMPSADILFQRAKSLRIKPDGLDKFCDVTSMAVWTRFFAPRLRAEKIAAAFAATPDPGKYAAAADKVREVYGLTAAEIEKLRFFACQVKAGEAFPKSLRRMLYLWGTTKKTGKTTTAEIIAALLNGDSRRGENIYTTSLSREMQVEAYAVPLITTCRCCVMDEAFYKDMRKTYNKFKQMMTTSDGTARLPYGQTFNWHGLPNYVATSNDGLKSFIEDYGDRRFLAVHFAKAPRQLTEEELTELWREFLTNAAPAADWQQWATDIAATADEQGARGVTVEDLTIFYQSPEWRDVVLCLPDCSAWSNGNRLSGLRLLAMTANHFGLQTIAREYRDEVERAFTDVFGEKVSGQSWWSIQHIKDIVKGDDGIPPTEETEEIEETEPFLF